jgi:hypothetical protein
MRLRDTHRDAFCETEHVERSLRAGLDCLDWIVLQRRKEADYMPKKVKKKQII